MAIFGGGTFSCACVRDKCDLTCKTYASAMIGTQNKLGTWQEKQLEKVKDYPSYLDYPKPHRPMTNADRIRSMTDDELVDWITRDCPGSPKPCIKVHYRVDCKSCWFDWLKQEADG